MPYLEGKVLTPYTIDRKKIFASFQALIEEKKDLIASGQDIEEYELLVTVLQMIEGLLYVNEAYSEDFVRMSTTIDYQRKRFSDIQGER